jgi:hypothetical protein
VFAQHRPESLIEIDALAQAQVDQILVTSNIMEQEEIRGRRNLPPASAALRARIAAADAPSPPPDAPADGAA